MPHPKSIRLFRLATATVTLAVVAALVLLGEGRGARAAAAIVLLFGAGQWLLLGQLGRAFHTLPSKED